MKEHVEGKRRAILQSIAGGAIAGSVGTALSSPVAAETDDNSCVQVDLVEMTDGSDIINPVDRLNKYNDENRLISWLWGNWEEEITGEDMDTLPYESQETNCQIETSGFRDFDGEGLEFSWDSDEFDGLVGLAAVDVELTECENQLEVALVSYDAPCGPGSPGWNGSEQFVYSINRTTLVGPEPQSLIVATPSEPPVTDGLVAHLDAGRINAEDGEDVDTWRDLTDNGNDATVEGGTPTYELEPDDGEAFLLSPAVRFGDDAWMTLGDDIVQTVDDATLFIVADADDYSDDPQFVGSENTGNEGGFGLAGTLRDENPELVFQYGNDEETEPFQSTSPDIGPLLAYYGSQENEEDFFASLAVFQDDVEENHAPYGAPGEIYLGADSAGVPSLNGIFVKCLFTIEVLTTLNEG